MTDFDEFLRKRNEGIAVGPQGAALPPSGQVQAWRRLKDELRRLADGKKLGVDKFEWSPYPAAYPDFLNLGDVAAVFTTPPAGILTPLSFWIMFAQRFRRADEVVVADSPLSAVIWRLTLDSADEVFYWNAKEQGLRLPTPQFAVKVAERLVEYFDEYNAAVKSKYPWASF